MTFKNKKNHYNYFDNEDLPNEENADLLVKDINGNLLKDGDSVHLTQDLKVKGSSLNIKRGTKVNKIRLTSNEKEVECRIGKSTIVLKTCFLKKV
ncbi:alkylphosphonate utilization protein [Candidatus Peregrinibacteria bacterium]|jgi:protein PhnA|nr:alkylphosphonate utilization protein [Candidatus Peregrinibacteria bacterium]